MNDEVSPTPAATPPLRHYDAATAEKGLFRNLLPTAGYFGTLWSHRHLVQNFFRRELLGRFRGSALGMFWVLVHPIFLFAIYYLVFGLLFGNWKLGQAPDPNFAIYLFSGTIAFQALIEGTTRACTSVVDNGNLVKKVAFPSELLPVHVIAIAMVVYLVGAAVCLTAGMWFGVLQPGWNLLLMPVLLAIQGLFTLGIGMLLANFHVFARDTSHLWGIVVTAWMFVTPVFWYPSLVTEKFRSEELGFDLAGWFEANPAYHMVMAHRIVLGAVETTGPDGKVLVSFGNLGEHLLVLGCWAVALFVLGCATFMSRRHKFADLV